MMLFPPWAAFGLGTAVLSGTTVLMQEKFKINGFVLAFWNKVACVTLTAPFVAYFGLPQQPLFYILAIISASFYAISDVIYFGSVSKIGAGPVSRILPASVVINFLLWFAVDPLSFSHYMQKPVIITICGVFGLWGYFATHLRKCTVSMQTVRAIWFCILASSIGPILAKGSANAAYIEQGLFGFSFIQALMMVIFWTFFSWARKPVPSSLIFSYRTWRYCLMVGAINTVSVIMGIAAIYDVDNPAYTSAVSYMNTGYILLAHKIMGHKDDSNVMAGAGMVACAVALIILKAQA